MDRKLKVASAFCLILSLLFSNCTVIIFADTSVQTTTEESSIDELQFGNTSDYILDGGSMAYYNKNKFYYIDEKGLHYYDCICEKDSVLSKDISVDCNNLNVFENKAYYTESNSNSGTSVLKSIDLNSLKIDTILEFKSYVDYLYVVNQQYATFLMEGVVYNYLFESKETETISTQKNITCFIPTTYGNLFSTGTTKKTIYANDKLVLSKVTSFYDDIGFLVFTKAEADYQVSLERLFSGSFIESEDVGSYSLYDEYDANDFFDNIGHNNNESKVGSKDIPTSPVKNSSTPKPADPADPKDVANFESDSSKVVASDSSSTHGYELTTNQKKIVDRAYKMYNAIWEAQKTVSGWKNNYYFKEGQTYHIPYGQPITGGKYIGFACSLDDFLKYSADINNKMYTSKSSNNSATSTYYANDCSAFVSYAWGISRHTTLSISNMGVSYGKSTSKLRIGDCLNKKSSHVVLITNIKKSSNASDIVEIIEQTPPQLKRSTYTKAELTQKYLNKGYIIYRYKDVRVSNNLGSKEKALNATFKVMLRSKELKNRPSEFGKKTRILSKGATVTVTAYLYNSAGSLWYKTSKGDYIFHSYLNATTNGKVPSNYINAEYMVDKTGVIKSTPYSAGKTVKKLSKGNIVRVINYVKNYQGEKWYYTTDGNVYSSSLRKITPLSETFKVMCSSRTVKKLPYKSSTTTRTLCKGNSVNITGYLYNSVGNLWYITSKGDYIFNSYLDSSSTGKAPSDYLNDQYMVDTTNCVIKSTPYSAGTTKKISKGTIVKVINYVKNSYGHKWYSTKEGYIYSGYLTKLKETS